MCFPYFAPAQVYFAATGTVELCSPSRPAAQGVIAQLYWLKKAAPLRIVLCMTDAEATSNLDQRICFCHGVDESEIRAAIKAGAHTVEAIQEKTKASTGCGGCTFEVERLLEEELAK